MNDLWSHKFVSKLIENLQPQIKDRIPKLRAAAREGKVTVEEEYEVSEQEMYDYEVFTQISSIISTVERMEHSKKFIKIFPRPRSYEKEGISQDIWIEYHYSYYVIFLVSLFDICLILTNEVFRLGNDQKSCRPDLIMKNYWVKETPVKESLKKIGKLIEPHKHDRNLHVHRGEVANIAFVMNSEDLDRLKLISLVQGSEKPLIDKELIDLAYNNETTKINLRLAEEIDSIKNSLSDFFKNLFQVYLINRDKISQ